MALLRRLPRSSIRSAKTVLVTALCMAALLAACGPDSAAPVRVSLLPDSTAKGEAWEWTPGCQPGPHRPSGCDAAGRNLRSAQVDGDEWNLGTGAATVGSVDMAVSSAGAFGLKGDLRSAPPCTSSDCIATSANTWVRGYPSLLYGINQCHANSSPPQSKVRMLFIRLNRGCNGSRRSLRTMLSAS